MSDGVKSLPGEATPGKERQRLWESESRYRSVVTAMAEGVILQDADSVILACNQAAETMLGLTADQMMGRTSLDPRWHAIHEDGSPFPGHLHPVPVTLQTGRPLRGVVMGVNKPDGVLTWLSINTEPLFRTGEGLPYAAVCTFSDITQRKQTEDALRRSEERYRRIIETTLEGVWIIDLDGNTIFANSRMAEILGCTPEAMVGSNIWDFADESDRAAVLRRLAGRARGLSEVHDFRCRRADGTYVWTSMATTPITHADGTKGALAMVRDVSEARRMESELSQSKEHLDLALSAAQMGTWELTLPEGSLTISPMVREILSLDTPIATRTEYFSRVHPDDRDELAAKMRRHLASTPDARFVNEYRIVRPDGQVRWVRSSGRALRASDGELRVLGLLSDITESRLLDEQLHQARQLESIGRLAGGVAHDFNNLLTVILASASIAAKPNRLDEELETIRAAAERGADLTRQLLAFARKQVMELAPLSLNAIVEGLAKVLERLVGEDVDLQFRLGELWAVRGATSQLEQVIVNLVVNGREAMPDGGPLTITTCNMPLDAEAAAQRELSAGDYVMLAVTDTGTGIDPATLPHIFEPFYTTKQSGTGLGLASAYGIVKQLGGHLRAHSAPGSGSKFEVYLPRDLEDARPVVPRRASVLSRPATTVLIVEDDELLRRVVVRGLVAVGFHVPVARDGKEGIAIASRHDGPLHAAVTDVIMPKASGRQFAEKLREIRPETPVLFVSGYTDDVIARHGVLEPGRHFLQKPYTIAELAERIDGVVSRS